MRAWWKRGHPRTYKVLLHELVASPSPEWRDWTTNAPVRGVPPLKGTVMESGACSAERYLGDYREAGCVPQK
jgi:hypothetical protein